MATGQIRPPTGAAWFSSPGGATLRSASVKFVCDKALVKAPGANRDSPAAESDPSTRGGQSAIVLFLVLLVVAIVPGIIGVAVEGMLYLSMGVLLLIANVGYLAVRSALRRRPTR
ncbi:hypothetical protein [Streptomyces sp. NPDC055287]